MTLDDFTVPGSNLSVGVNLDFKREALGGHTSSTASAHLGIKPKQVNVTTLIDYKDADQISALVSVAEALNEQGDLHVYTVVDDTCDAMRIHQVQFSGSLMVRAVSQQVHAWRVSFTLTEYLSVPEKIEQRQPITTPTEQTAPGNPVASPINADSTNTDTEALTLTRFEQVLQHVDDLLAPQLNSVDS